MDHFSRILLIISLTKFTCNAQLVISNIPIGRALISNELAPQFDVQCLIDFLQNGQQRSLRQNDFIIILPEHNFVDMPNEESLIKVLNEQQFSPALTMNWSEFIEKQTDLMTNNLLMFAQTINRFNAELMNALRSHTGYKLVVNIMDAVNGNIHRMAHFHQIGSRIILLNVGESVEGQCNCDVKSIVQSNFGKEVNVHFAFKTIVCRLEPFAAIDKNDKISSGVEIDLIETISKKLNISVVYQLEGYAQCKSNANVAAGKMFKA